MSNPAPVPRHLATTERRSRAAVLVAQAAVATDDPVLVVDAIDLITGAIFAVAGVDPEPACPRARSLPLVAS